MPTPEIAWLLLPDLMAAVLAAGALVAVLYLVQVLRRGVDRLAGRLPQPVVTAALEPSVADGDHINLVVENCGFAPAFDVRIVATPAIPAAEGFEDRPADWPDVSLLRPGQAMVGYACRADQLVCREVHIDVSWTSRPGTSDRTQLGYRLDMRRLPFQVPFGPPLPRDELLHEIKSLRRDLRTLVRGERTLRVAVSAEPLPGAAKEVRGEPRRDSRPAQKSSSRRREPGDEPGSASVSWSGTGPTR